MGDSEEGGGGSVKWRLETEHGDDVVHEQNGKKVKQKGRDDDEKAETGFHFTVSIQVPNGFTRDEFLEHLRSDSGLKKSTKDDERVYFNLEIEEDRPKQIRVSWGKSDHHEGTGGTKPLLDTRTTT